MNYKLVLRLIAAWKKSGAWEYHKQDLVRQIIKEKGLC